MFGIKNRLNRWRDADLISDTQYQTILDYETSKQQGRFGRGLVAVSLFAIMVGVLSIIAANWSYIPGTVKIVVHFAMNAAAAFSVVRFHKLGNKVFAHEAALFIFFALNLTMIALIGQVFQIEGNLANACFLWMLISSPAIFFFGKTRIIYVPWMLAFLGTIALGMEEYMRQFDDFWGFSFAYVIALFVPLGMISAGQFSYFKDHKPDFASMFVHAGVVLLTLVATAAAQMWYADWAKELPKMIKSAGGDPHKIGQIGVSYSSGYLVLFGVFALAMACTVLHAARHKFYAGSKDLQAGLTHLFVCIAFISAPILLPTGKASLLAMFSFIVYWLYMGWFGHRLGSTRIVSLAIAVLALRVFLIYIEAFGSLMSTGFGLIFGGVFMLALIFAAKKVAGLITGDMEGHKS